MAEGTCCYISETESRMMIPSNDESKVRPNLGPGSTTTAPSTTSNQVPTRSEAGLSTNPTAVELLRALEKAQPSSISGTTTTYSNLSATLNGREVSCEAKETIPYTTDGHLAVWQGLIVFDCKVTTYALVSVADYFKETTIEFPHQLSRNPEQYYFFKEITTEK